MAKKTSPKVAESSEKPKAKKTKTAVSLTDEAIKRLSAACTIHQLDQSEIVEWLIQERLSGYVISVRGEGIPIGRPKGQSEGQASPSASVDASDRPDPGAHVNSPALVNPSL